MKRPATTTEAPNVGRIDPQVITDYVDPPGAREPPPDVRLEPPNAPSSIAGSILVRASFAGGSPFRYAGIAEMRPGPPPYGAYLYPAGSITSSLTTGLSYRVQFVTDADQLEIATIGNGATIHIRVDGQLVAGVKPPADGSGHLIRLAWSNASSARHRRVLVECSVGAAFGGVRVPRGRRIEPPPAPRGPRMIVVGDSWTDGTGSDGINDHAYIAGQLLGIVDTWVAGVGGTGYLQDSKQGRHIGARLAADVVAHHPDIVVFCYGSNDISFSPARIAAAARADWRRVKGALPRASIIVEGPWPAAGANAKAAGSIAAIDAALRAAARSEGLPYVSPVERAWIKGSGYAGHENGSGNSDKLIGPDGIHPSQLGHLYVGRLEATAWRPSLSAFLPQRKAG